MSCQRHPFFFSHRDPPPPSALLTFHPLPVSSGSSTGQKEFMGVSTSTPAYAPLNHFGSGDIPFDATKYAALSAANQFIQVPFVIGGIAFFSAISLKPAAMPCPESMYEMEYGFAAR